MMRDNYELANNGFKVLHSVMVEFIWGNMKNTYRSGWWNEIRRILADRLNELPDAGEDAFLANSLDRANCIRVLDRHWYDLFNEAIQHPEQEKSCHIWIKELMGVRNVLAHDTLNDISLHDAERALDTMILVCEELSPLQVADIKVFYDMARAKSQSGTNQPEENVDYIYPRQEVQGNESEGSVNLFNLIGTDWVQSTGISKKITIDGKTMSYPVYRISLSEVFYNDQNDRIATWIAKYKAENGEDTLSNLSEDREKYNDVIEDFIVKSNPDAIRRTQLNIETVDQREPGVVLNDGRIVDGNRRFTCLRRLQRDKETPYFFEAVILDGRYDRKQIKMLELTLQHGEEKKVDYDLIDYALGTYRDIEKTKLLTVEEYAQSANEKEADVKKRLEIARIIEEFLEYIKLPEHYHVARDYQVYSLFDEMLAPLKQLKNDEERKTLKKIAFNNTLMHAVPDQRKFIRDNKTIIKAGNYSDYFVAEKILDDKIHGLLENLEVTSKEDLDDFAKDNTGLIESMCLEVEKALQATRKEQIKAKPVENIRKCISLLCEIDERLIGALDNEDKLLMKEEMNKLAECIAKYKEMMN